jgi:hypothetical protein
MRAKGMVTGLLSKRMVFHGSGCPKTIAALLWTLIEREDNGALLGLGLRLVCVLMC